MSCVETVRTQTEANCNRLSLLMTLCTAVPSNGHISAQLIWQKPQYWHLIVGECFIYIAFQINTGWFVKTSYFFPFFTDLCLLFWGNIFAIPLIFTSALSFSLWSKWITGELHWFFPFESTAHNFVCCPEGIFCSQVLAWKVHSFDTVFFFFYTRQGRLKKQIAWCCIMASVGSTTQIRCNSLVCRISQRC